MPKSNTHNNWYTKELAEMKDRLLFLHKLKTDSNCEVLHKKYIDLKNLYKISIREAKLACNVLKIENSSNKCRAAWNIINENTKSSSTYLQKIEITPDSFNTYFIDSVKQIQSEIGKVSTESYILLARQQVQRQIFSFTQVSEKDVSNAIKRLKSSESRDIYSLSNTILKRIANAFLTPFTISINKCLMEGVFPDELKISRICPVYKKGPRNLAQSYRPISIIPTISKIIEIIVHDQLVTYLENNNYLSLSQFGFRRGKCAIDAVDALVSSALNALEAKAFAQATLCDLSKAFDCVPHCDLIQKLNYYGIQGTSSDFFVSYLHNRRQKVFINGLWSNEAFVTTGVPQGSVLGPLLFLLHVNDLPNFIKAKSFLYADDTTFFNVHNNFNELQDLVKNTVEEASLWFQSNGFLLNNSKTQNILFSLRQTPLGNTSNDFCSSVKFLGIYIDSSLNWNDHIYYISKKLSRVIFLLKKISNYVPISYYRSSYFAYFESIVRYGLLIWGNSSKIEEILLLQKKAVRILAGAQPLDHCKPLFIKLKIQTVINLYIFNLISYAITNVYRFSFQNHIHSYNTRNRNNIAIEHCRLSKTQNSHIIMAQKVYNKLEHLLSKYPTQIFLNKFFDWLLMTPFYSIQEFFNVREINF